MIIFSLYKIVLQTNRINYIMHLTSTVYLNIHIYIHMFVKYMSI